MKHKEPMQVSKLFIATKINEILALFQMSEIVKKADLPVS